MEQPTGTPTTPAGVVACADRVLADLDETMWVAKSSEELVEAVVVAERLRAHLAALEAGVLAEVHARGVAKGELAWGSTAEWFTHLAGTHRGTGHQTIRHADTLVNERTATHSAMVAGRVSPEQAAVIVDAIDRLPTDPGVRADGEAFLLDAASRLNATDLAKAARHLVEVADLDGAERRTERELERQDRAAHHGRFLAIVEDGAGGIRLRGRGTVEDGAAIKAALLPLTKPQPAVDPRDPDGDQTVDPRDHGARLWDALVETCRHALTTDLPPDCHGARPRIAVTTSLEVLQLGLDLGRIDWGTLGTDLPTTDDGLELTPAVVRRMACDADLIPIALGTQGEVLDVGRTSRLVTPAIWRALVCRDRHCAFPGCTRPPVMGHAHHITHWVEGGITSLANLVLLCGHHHRVIHHTPWQVRLNPADGRPEFLPPQRPGAPPPSWIRTRRRE
ncbi:HNH endonuclease signature motif containing protein [Nocardioides ungokensis]